MTSIGVKLFFAGLVLGIAATETYELNRLPRTGEVQSWFEPNRTTGNWYHNIGSLSGPRGYIHSPDSECDICGPVDERP